MSNSAPRSLLAARSIFAPYRDRSWLSLNTLDCDYPRELVEEMIAEARSALKYGAEDCKKI